MTQLEESEEARRLNHKTILRHVNRDEDDARQIALLQCRIRSGETVDQEHRPRADTHEGDRRGKDHLFLTNADPEQVKAVLESFGVGSSISSYVGKRSRSQIGGVRVEHSDQLTGLG